MIYNTQLVDRPGHRLRQRDRRRRVGLGFPRGRVDDAPPRLHALRVRRLDGSGARGMRRSPPQRKSPIVGIAAFGSRKPGRIGCTLRKRSPAQSGEALMRSSRAPSAFLPSDFMLRYVGSETTFPETLAPWIREGTQTRNLSPTPLLPLPKAARRGNSLACQPSGIVGREEHGDSRNVLGLPQTS